MNFRAFILFTVACATTMILTASPAYGQSRSATSSFNFRFSLIALAPDEVKTAGADGAVDLSLEGVSYETRGIVRRLESIPFRTRGRSYLYRGEGPLTFFREETDREGNPVRKVLAEVAPGPRWRSVIILAKPLEQGGETGFEAEVIQDDPAAFPENSVLLINRSRQPVTVDLDGAQRAIAAGERVRLPVSVGQFKSLPIRFLDRPGQGGKRLYSTALAFHPGQRVMVLIEPDPHRAIQVPPLIIVDHPARTRFDEFDPAQSPQS